MKRESTAFRNFSDRVLGWSFCPRDQLEARITDGEKLLRQIPTGTELDEAVHTMDAMRGQLKKLAPS